MNQPLKNHKPLNAVVVSHDATRIKTLANLLTEGGLSVKTFDGPIEAMEAMGRDSPPEIIIIELLMQGIDGLRLCRLLRSAEYESFNQVPILILSQAFGNMRLSPITTLSHTTTNLKSTAFFSIPLDESRFLEQVRLLLQGLVAPQDPFRVLIVEQDPVLANSLKKAFKNRGYLAHVASSGRQAKGCLRTEVYNLVILDGQLPDNGSENLLVSLQQKQADTIYIMTASDIHPEKSLKWMKKGAAAILSKSDDPGDLVELCRGISIEQALLSVESQVEGYAQKVHDSETQYRDLFNSMLDGFAVHEIIFDPDGRIVDFRYLSVNPAFERLIGMKPDQVIGKRYLEIVPGDKGNVTDVIEMVGRVAITGIPVRFEHYSRVIDKHLELQAFRPKQGQVACVFQDITGKKRTEAELRQSRNDLAKAQSLAHLGNYIWEKDMLRCSDEMLRIFDCEGQTPSYQLIESRIHPEDLKRARKALSRAIKERIPINVEYRIIRTNGEIRWVYNRGDEIECDSQGTFVRIFGTVQDITERKQAEEALRESEKRYRVIVENINDALYIIDFMGHILDVNDNACRMLGYAREELIKENYSKIISEEYNRQIAERRDQFLNEGSILVKGGHVRKDGTLIPVEVSAKVVSREGNGIVQAFVRDITERLKAEKQQQDMERQLLQAQKMEAIGSLAGGVAHDLNNLLSPILGYAELLQDDLGPNDFRRECVNDIIQAGLRAKDIVRQMLAFSRKQTMEVKVANLNDILSNFEKLLRRTVRENIKIQTIPGPDIPLVRVDAGQIEQVIMNLVVNAQDAMPDGGILTIETTTAQMDAQYCARHADSRQGAYAMLAVSDTGSGMDPETSKRIFEPFFSTKGEHGTGLGLATTYGIVKQHKGNIWVYSEPGKGTTFKIYLPAIEGTVDKTITGAGETGNLNGSETVLLAEDNDPVRMLTSEILHRLGYTVLQARNGAEALSILDTHKGPLNLLLTDVVMPDMNGRELFDKVSARHPDIKVLYTSGYTADVISHHGVLEKGIKFIQKPFSVQGMAAKVREVLDSGSPS